MLPAAPQIPSSLGIGKDERAEAREKIQSYKHRPKKIRRGGTLSLISDQRIIKRKVPDETIDIVPPIMGVISKAFICPGENILIYSF